MRNLGRTVTALAGVLSLLVSGAEHSALADDAIMYIDGSGTFSPGLSTTPTAQNVKFCGTGTVAAGNHAGTYEFCFDGTDPAGTTVSGNGSGTLTGDITGNVSFARTGNVVTLSGNVSYGGTNGTIASAHCYWVMVWIPPVWSFTFICVWRLTH